MPQVRVRLSFVAGFLVGGVVGWVLGIVSAPHSGRATRTILSEKAIDLHRRAGEAADRVREEVVSSLMSTEQELSDESD
jgi:gas vesicle protein